MAFIHGSRATVYLNGYDISSYTKSVSQSVSLDTADATVLGNTAKQYVTGQQDSTASIDGIFDGAAAGSDFIVSTAIAPDGVEDQLLWFPQGGTIGLPCLAIGGFVNNYEAGADVGDVSNWSAQIQSTYGMDRGVILHPMQAEAVGGNSTGVNQTASSSNGAVAYLQATAGTTLIVKVQDSADNSAWADIAGLTFTSLSTRGYQRLSVTGTIRQYVRALWTGSGTFALGFSRK